MGMTSTERARLTRERQARGVLAVVQTEITQDIAAALLNDGYLDSDSGPKFSKADVGVALNYMLRDWADGRHN